MKRRPKLKTEDAGLSRIFREAKRKNANSPTFTLDEVERRLGLGRRRRVASK
jgi:hypothetical protein